MAQNPLPPGASGKDAVDIVFAGCTNRTTLIAGIGSYAIANGIAAGAVGIVVGFGVTWLVARHLRAKKVIG